MNRSNSMTEYITILPIRVTGGLQGSPCSASFWEWKRWHREMRQLLYRGRTVSLLVLEASVECQSRATTLQQSGRWVLPLATR